MKRYKNIFHANGIPKKAGGAVVISDKIDVKRNRRSLLNNGVTSSREYSNYKS